MADVHQHTPVIIDNGTNTVKIGFGGEEKPRSVIPTVVALERGHLNPDDSPMYVGKEALKKMQQMEGTGLTTLKYPIQRGFTNSWVQMEELWDYSFEELSIQAEMHPMIVTCNAFTPQKHREKICEIMFETFKIPKLFVAIPGYLSLYTSGDNSGIVLESGEGVTNIIPVNEGIVSTQLATRFPIAGKDITDYLLRLVLEKGYSFDPHQEKKIARHIKHSMCYTAFDFDDELVGCKQEPETFEQSLDLNSGETIKLSSEAFRACELMFEPSLIGAEGLGVHHLLLECINSFDSSLKKLLFRNVVLGGGNMVFPGMAERMEKELKSLTVGQNVEIKVHPNENQFSAWQGGSILSCLPEFEKNWITQDDYIDAGPSIVFKKCF